MKKPVVPALAALACLLVCGCTYAVEGNPTYEVSGVARLYDYPPNRAYQSLGLHSWGFYRPSFSEPTLADVWEALSGKVTALGGNACIVRYEQVGHITARTLTVTCEVLNVGDSVAASGAHPVAPSAALSHHDRAGMSPAQIDRAVVENPNVDAHAIDQQMP